MLHGEIKVNDVEFGRWSAVRKESIGGDAHLYDCVVVYRDMRGYLLTANFSVAHSYADGALALTATVLEKSQGYLRRDNG